MATHTPLSARIDAPDCGRRDTSGVTTHAHARQPHGPSILGMLVDAPGHMHDWQELLEQLERDLTDGDRRDLRLRNQDAVTPHPDRLGLTISLRPSPAPHLINWPTTGVAVQWEAALPTVQAWRNLEGKPFTELRGLLREQGLPAARSKADAIASLRSTPEGRGARRPDAWPTVVAGRHHLIVRATGGPAVQVIDGLLDARAAGELAMSTRMPGVMNRGLFLFDARDETAASQAQRIAGVDWTEARMAEVAGALAGMKADGYRIYAVEVSRRGTEATTGYFLNASSPDSGQFFGWFTLEQIVARDFPAQD